jgi:CBS domain containing-hemolysin-like protein
MNFISILPLLANTGAEISRDLPSLGVTLLYLLGIALFLLMNAFFVASEFAIVKVRASQLETEGKDKPKRSAIAKDVIRHLDGYLSATQLGITIASLALGYLGEPFVQALVAPILLKIPHFPEQAIAPISIGLAIASFTFLHVVIGELLPKSLAIRLALPVTLAVVRPLHWSTWFSAC